MQIATYKEDEWSLRARTGARASRCAEECLGEGVLCWAE